MAETRKNGENVSRSQPVGVDPPTGATGPPTNSSAVDPYQRKWNLWGYVDARDVGQSCRLTLEADIIGVEAIIIAKSDTVMNRPSREMLAEVFSGVPLRGEIAEFESLLSSSKASKVLGYCPQYSWRTAS